MSTPQPQPLTTWRRWIRFWFAPSDPSTMAFLRIITGILVFYTHLAYSFDLYSFFGQNGWYGRDAINRERREFPWATESFSDGWKWWEETVRFPEEPHRRTALLAYIRSLPTDLPTLNRKLAVLSVEPADAGGYPPAVAQTAPLYANTLSEDPKVRENTLKALSNQIPRDPKEQFPPAFDALSDANKPTDPNWRLKKLAIDLDEFYSTLPVAVRSSTDSAESWDRKRRAADDSRKFIVLFLFETNEVNRYNFLKFARDLACPAEEREKKLDYFSYWNIEKRYTQSIGNPIFSLWFHIYDPTEMAIAHCVMLVIMLMFTLGLFTRVTAVLTWLAAITYIHRNQQVLFGQDTMMNILLIYLMIANCGSTLSLDRLIARYRAAKASLRRSGTIDQATAKYLEAPLPSVASGFAQRLLQIHFCFIYMAAGLSKLKGATWWNTSAFWDTMANPEFTMIHYEWYQELLRMVVSQRAIYSAMTAFGVGFTLFVEISLPYLVWTKLRPFIIVLGMLMHFGIGVFMGLLIFSLLMMTMLASYLPGAAIRRQLFGEPPTEKVILKVDPTNEGSVNSAAKKIACDMTGKYLVQKQ